MWTWARPCHRRAQKSATPTQLSESSKHRTHGSLHNPWAKLLLLLLLFLSILYVCIHLSIHLTSSSRLLHSIPFLSLTFDSVLQQRYKQTPSKFTDKFKPVLRAVSLPSIISLTCLSSHYPIHMYIYLCILCIYLQIIYWVYIIHNYTYPEAKHDVVEQELLGINNALDIINATISQCSCVSFYYFIHV